MSHEQFQSLKKHLTDIASLSGITALLHWDQETYMPSGSIEARSQQLGLMSSLIHQKRTGKEFEKTLSQLIDLETGTILGRDLSSQKKRCLQEILKDYKKEKALPPEFVEEASTFFPQCQHAWAEARKNNDFKAFRPYLEKAIELAKRKAQYLKGESSLYNALIDEFEPHMTEEKLDQVFAPLKEETIKLLKDVQEKQDPELPSFLRQKFNLDRQWDLGMMVLRKMGLDEKFSRQDRSTHPFTIDIHPTDVRVTTRFKEDDLMEGLSSSIHEGGHALYELGMDKEWFGTPLAQSISMGIHESQSRLWEIFVGKNYAFWEGIYPTVQDYFPHLKTVSLDEFYRAINYVSPGLIRVESDEVTYNLHIMVRYEMEKLMINGTVNMHELPEIWNEKYQSYLGVTPDSDSNGILQDVHWAGGAFGYFPSYSLGNLYAAQFFHKAQEEILNLNEHLKKTNYTLLTHWLQNKIHSVGRGKTADDLVLEVTGQPLTSKFYVELLRQKFASFF